MKEGILVAVPILPVRVVSMFFSIPLFSANQKPVNFYSVLPEQEFDIQSFRDLGFQGFRALGF